MVKENGILRKSITTFVLIAGAIYIPFQFLEYLKKFGYSTLEIFAGWGFLYILILFIYACYAYFKQGKNYFVYSAKILKFIVYTTLLPIVMLIRLMINMIIGIYYLQYLKDVVNQNKKTNTQQEEEKMEKRFSKLFRDLFDVPTNTNQSKKVNKKGQVVFIALLIAALIILFILVFLIITRK